MPTYANHIYTYSTPGTFSLIIPFDADYMSILVVGGGGGGGGWSNDYLGDGGGGGGGGGVIIQRDIPINSSATYTLTVGAGGSGGGGYSNGNSGSNSNFTSSEGWALQGTGGGYGTWPSNASAGGQGGTGGIGRYVGSTPPGTLTYGSTYSGSGGNGGYSSYTTGGPVYFLATTNGGLGPLVSVYDQTSSASASLQNRLGVGGNGSYGSGTDGGYAGTNGTGNGGAGACRYYNVGGTGGSGCVQVVFHFGKPILLSEIGREAGDTSNFPIGTYRAGGGKVPTGTLGYPGDVETAIPSSGSIKFGNFYGYMPKSS